MSNNQLDQEGFEVLMQELAKILVDLTDEEAIIFLSAVMRWKKSLRENKACG